MYEKCLYIWFKLLGKKIWLIKLINDEIRIKNLVNNMVIINWCWLSEMVIIIGIFNIKYYGWLMYVIIIVVYVFNKDIFSRKEVNIFLDILVGYYFFYWNWGGGGGKKK